MGIAIEEEITTARIDGDVDHIVCQGLGVRGRGCETDRSSS